MGDETTLMDLLITRLTEQVAKITGVSDPSLAEFIVEIHSKCQSADEFAKKLAEMGAEFPQDFVTKVDEMICPKSQEPTRDMLETVLSEEVATKELPRGRPSVPSVYSLPNTKPVRDDYEAESRQYTQPRRALADVSEIQVGQIYDAVVKNITKFGAFASLVGFKRNVDGLVHISAIRNFRVESVAAELSRGEKIKVKVLSVDTARNKISLSMKDVDQDTGQDLKSFGDHHSSFGGTAAPAKRKRLSSPERWELRQLIASGAIPASEYPELQDNEQEGHEEDDDQVEENIEIEVKEQEPPFLQGQTRQTLDLEPIRVVRAPDGSMNRAALTSVVMARERREIRIAQEKKERLEEEKAQAMNRQTAAENNRDPLAQSNDDKNNNNNNDSNEEIEPDEEESEDQHVLNGDDRPHWKQKGIAYGKRSTLSMSEQRKQLPVYQLKDELLQAIRDNQILIVVGETGSGKTTQISQFLLEAGYASSGKKIACTQPRRVAAISVAKRVSEEQGCQLGQEVGYNVRFDDRTSSATKIKYLTDGMLQREALADGDMSQYSVLMLDEAHERTISTDVLFALAKKAAANRPDFKLIVTSATLDAERFSEYFGNCPIMHVPGRTYPVDIVYTKEPEMDYLDAALMTVMQIHLSEPPGDILVFLTGQEEIDAACEMLRSKVKVLGGGIPDLIILPVYSSLPSEMQSKIFEPAEAGSRKVVIATNIAETSITIDGVYYVIDPGFAKVNAYDPRLGMDSLLITPISQAQANQRSGRAGRTGPGKCYRLYTEAAFQNEMLPNSVPEIQRQNLAHTILMLKAMGINDLLHFDFMDPPPQSTLQAALEQLYGLSALDDEGFLTKLGRRMADFPMEPALSKVLIASVDAGCAQEVLTIIAMLSVQTIFYRPRDKKDLADRRHAKFADSSGDHLTLLHVYSAWQRSGCSKAWCSDNFVQERSLLRAQDVRKQLVMIMGRYGRRGAPNAFSSSSAPSGNLDTVRKVLCSGYFRNTARRDPKEGYKTLVENTPVYMHPSSVLFRKQAQYVLYHTLLLTSKEYMHCATIIDPKWLIEVAPTVFKTGDMLNLSKRKKMEKIQPLHNKYASDPNEWRLSAQRKIIRNANATSYLY